MKYAIKYHRRPFVGALVLFQALHSHILGVICLFVISLGDCSIFGCCYNRCVVFKLTTRVVWWCWVLVVGVTET